MSSVKHSRPAVALLAPLLVACLPEDTRTAPGKLRVDVQGTEAASSVVTSDGFSVHFDRFLVTLGRVRLGGDDCNTYSEPEYDRIVDAQQLTRQKLNELYALGSCDVGFRVAGPSGDTLLTQGVTDNDKTRLRTSQKDALGEGSAAIEVAGSADNGVIHKHFAWSFRERVFYDRCPVMGPAAPLVKLASHDEQTLVLTLHGDALFAVNPFNPDSELLFAPFAQADDELGNGDGEIDASELALVDISEAVAAAIGAGGAPFDSLAGDFPLPQNLAELLRTVGFPAVARFSENEPCALVGVGSRPPGEGR